ncbi:broad specificity phosphatase PhoE [Mumia flava]|uniref:Broad specificity phosphatase PhoE n=1 Tax=Mumia flava TaxID=1348852 RepID=A0A2M9B798_9ACTN|nr:histidine phosphatase family protein [Mumia flava]PJJ53821.1 broad specificity phosphatase PhoE [Mumia flava]
MTAGAADGGAARNPMAGWRDAEAEPPTTLVLLRHGVTENTLAKRFCGSGGSDPGLSEEGRAQAARAAALISARGGADAVVASPLRRTRETAATVAEVVGRTVVTEELVAETAFGAWDGLTFAQVQERDPDGLDAWLGSTAIAPPGGESYDAVDARVREAFDRLVAAYAGRTVVVVSHVTPIKLFVRLALGAPMSAIHRLELQPASISTVRVWPDGIATVRELDLVP